MVFKRFRKWLKGLKDRLVLGWMVPKTRLVESRDRHKDKNGNMIPTPFIVIGGKWLARLGFKRDDKFRIYGKRGLIIVKLLKRK